MDLRHLSSDEIALISDFTPRRNFSNLRPSLDIPTREFNRLDAMRCKNRELQFEQIAGVSLDELILKLKHQHKYIDKIIQYFEYRHKVRLDDQSREYFHKIFGFTFEAGIMYSYIQSIFLHAHKTRMSRTSDIFNIGDYLQNNQVLQDDIESILTNYRPVIPLFEDQDKFVFGNFLQ